MRLINSTKKCNGTMNSTKNKMNSSKNKLNSKNKNNELIGLNYTEI